MAEHECDSGNFDRTICPLPCGAMHSYCDTCGRLQDRCAHDAPDRTESPTEGTAGLLAAHELSPPAGDSLPPRPWTCGCGMEFPSGWTAEMLHRAHLAALLDAHVTERCAETLEEAARELPGFDGIRTHGDAARWLRDRAAGVRGAS